VLIALSAVLLFAHRSAPLTAVGGVGVVVGLLVLVLGRLRSGGRSRPHG
jgi:hypothetical protein